MKFLKNHWPSIITFLLSFCIFSFRLAQSASFEGDLGRDLYEIARISYGKISLLGPKGSFGGLYTTPYYFYLLLPSFIAFGRHLDGILFLNALLFSLSLAFFCNHVSKKFGTLAGLLSGSILMLFPFFVSSARRPGNGFTHIPLFIIFLSIAYFYDWKKLQRFTLLLLGFFLGVIFSMLFAYASIALSILLLIFFTMKNKKRFFIFFIGLTLAFSPLLIFEIKNHFIMIKNTFIDKSYLSFINNANLPGGIKLSKNIFLNALFLVDQMSSLLNANTLFILAFLTSSLIWIKKQKVRYFVFATLLSFLFLITMLRYQYSPHYLLPFLTLMSFTLLIVILNSSFHKIVFVFLIVILLLFFPKNYYQNARVPYQLVKSRVDKMIARDWLKKRDAFNVLLIRNDDKPTPTGFEYRFFLLKQGYKPQSEFLYKASQKLIIFSEKKNLDPSSFKSWEISEFNRRKIKNSSFFSPDDTMTIYYLTH